MPLFFVCASYVAVWGWIVLCRRFERLPMLGLTVILCQLWLAVAFSRVVLLLPYVISFLMLSLASLTEAVLGWF